MGDIKAQKHFNSVIGSGHTWWAKFKKRHEKEITLQKPDKLDRGKSHMANVNVMAQHFNLLKKILSNLDLFNKLDQIFNCIESGIQLDARTGKVCIFSKTFIRP